MVLFTTLEKGHAVIGAALIRAAEVFYREPDNSRASLLQAAADAETLARQCRLKAEEIEKGGAR